MIDHCGHDGGANERPSVQTTSIGLAQGRSVRVDCTDPSTVSGTGAADGEASVKATSPITGRASPSKSSQKSVQPATAKHPALGLAGEFAIGRYGFDSSINELYTPPEPKLQDYRGQPVSQNRAHA
ncbi:hypothetical protein [Stieleria mannarensis]|uniref:hypothetical protein n=1 Tax=Stieleria mannarensis TaxID=2755585 RepID=UPI001601E543|nr:hypothetical protein [Rhodopirellula sp. JC639]